MSGHTKDIQPSPPRESKLNSKSPLAEKLLVAILTAVLVTAVMWIFGLTQSRLSASQVQSVANYIADTAAIRSVIFDKMRESGHFVGDQGPRGFTGAQGPDGAKGADMSIGSIVGYLGDSAVPEGWLLCDGRDDLETAAFPELFSVIGTRYGGRLDTSGAVFTLPDLRGVFLRGLDEKRGIDSDRAFHELQDHAVGPHQHEHTDATKHHPNSRGTSGTGNLYGYSSELRGNMDLKTRDTTETGKGIDVRETRPVNMAVRWIIKATHPQ